MNADEMTRPVRVYTDIPQSLDIALKIHCAKTGKSRKKFLAEIIEQQLHAEARTRIVEVKARSKKG